MAVLPEWSSMWSPKSLVWLSLFCANSELLQMCVEKGNKQYCNLRFLCLLCRPWKQIPNRDD